MAVFNAKDRIIECKLVYYGPGRGGKTTNLEYIFKAGKKYTTSEMVSINTKGDRTLFFDFLPLDIGQIKGYNVKFQLYTVPGQVKYDATRRLVLRGVDGIVFVADSLKVRRATNIASLKNLHENLSFYSKDIFKMPLVLQYNKRDLVKEGLPLLSVDALEADLNSRLKAPAIEASAISGKNVVLTLKTIISLTIKSLKNELV